MGLKMSQPLGGASDAESGSCSDGNPESQREKPHQNGGASISDAATEERLNAIDDCPLKDNGQQLRRSERLKNTSMPRPPLITSVSWASSSVRFTLTMLLWRV